MVLPKIPDATPVERNAAVEGKAWCPDCDRVAGYTVTKIEFLGNPVKASFFCVECGGRMFPGATEKESALRLRAGARWLRLGAAGSFLIMLLLPLLLAAIGLYLLWRIF